jgi:hypothetical protein
VKIKCITLFDVTKTNVISRRHRHENRVGPELTKQRSQQSNFETLLQIISMRTQPEDITDPEKLMLSTKKSEWGTDYINKTKIPVWQFTFTVSQDYVFHDGESQIGNLIKDSHGIPMITGLDEYQKVKNTIDITDQYRNIYFEVISDDNENNQ